MPFSEKIFFWCVKVSYVEYWRVKLSTLKLS